MVTVAEIDKAIITLKKAREMLLPSNKIKKPTKEQRKAEKSINRRLKAER